MVVLRTDIERALDELVSQEEGMRFQGLAVMLGKKRWPELIARQRKKDLGLDAYASSSLAPDHVGKGLAASITPTLKKISDDAKRAKENFPDLQALLFVTPERVGNAYRARWEEAILKEHGLELYIIEREEIISVMMMPENASLCASYLHMKVDAEPQVADIIERVKRAADSVTQAWLSKMKGYPLIDLAAVQIASDGAESADVMSLQGIGDALLQSGRVVLEGPAGCGKTTTLIQLAQRAQSSSIPFIVELPAWTSSRRHILEYIARMPAFQAEGLNAADLARVRQIEPFLLLLNGWNEVAQSNSEQANEALRELERDFPSAGIVVATRTYHLIPPLPGAQRLQLLPLRRKQRAAYLSARFGVGTRSAELRDRIDADPALDELTRTPFVLSEVVSLFEAGAHIPTRKIDVLAEVLRLQEQREEHCNALHIGPLFGRQSDYLKALATEMTRRGAVTLSEADARSVSTIVMRKLVEEGQVEPVAAPLILATLTAHHVLVRVDYPQSAYQFEHQQLQEYYSALDVRARLLSFRDSDQDAINSFKAGYVNDPAWAEPLRMIAETFSMQTGDSETGQRNSKAGAMLIEMALAVDLVFAGELAWYCGAAVWNEVCATVGERYRSVYAIAEGSFQKYSIAAMIATGSDDFSDIIVPLLSAEDQQIRLETYRLRPGLHLSSLGTSWHTHVRNWSEAARMDFVAEMLHRHIDEGVVRLAVEDDSIGVKSAAALGLMSTGSEEALAQVLKSMDAQTFEEFARKQFDYIPKALRRDAVLAMRRFIDRATNQLERLRAALDLIALGESGLCDVVKRSLMALPRKNLQHLDSRYLRGALEYLHKEDFNWLSEWVVSRVADGAFYDHQHWLPFATPISDGLVEKHMRRLQVEDLRGGSLEGTAAVVATCADVDLAIRVFSKIRELRRSVDAEPSKSHGVEWNIMRQLEVLLRQFPDDLVVEGALRATKDGDPLNVKIASEFFGQVPTSDVEPLCVEDEHLKERLRVYLKSSVNMVLGQDDFSGGEKAKLAMSIAQVGSPEDLTDLLRLIKADIERVRRGRVERLAGMRGPLAEGCVMSYAHWHVAAIMHLNPGGAEQVLIDLLSESEYRSEVAAAMARDFVPNQNIPFKRTFDYDLMWAARENRSLEPAINQRRALRATALITEINRLKEQRQDGESARGLKELAKALAAVDPRGSAEAVLDAIALPGQWDEFICLDTVERLMIAGIVLPTTTLFPLVDSVLNRTEKWMQESDRSLLAHLLRLCPFVDEPAAGFAKIREVIGKRRLSGYGLCELVTALGESRSDGAVDLLSELASNPQDFERCEGQFVNALATLDTPHACEFLLGFVDPSIQSIAQLCRFPIDALLVARIAELGRTRQEVTKRLMELCEIDLPEHNRKVLSKVMGSLGTLEALVANLKLICDARSDPIPRGVWDQLHNAFVERENDGRTPYTYTVYARASNELRSRLFIMTTKDKQRWKSASILLGRIEEWRLEFGRPVGEPRHPDIASDHSWPPLKR